MGHSSLLGIDRVPGTPPGRDTQALGPGDSSDSGSDLMGLDDPDTADPNEPADIAMDPDRARAAAEGLGESSTDQGGTGERRSAAGDAGGREAADISVDRVIDARDLAAELDDLPPEDLQDLATLDAMQDAMAADDAGEDEVADPLDDEEREDDEADASDTQGPRAGARGRRRRAVAADDVPDTDADRAEGDGLGPTR